MARNEKVKIVYSIYYHLIVMDIPEGTVELNEIEKKAKKAKKTSKKESVCTVGLFYISDFSSVLFLFVEYKLCCFFLERYCGKSYSL